MEKSNLVPCLWFDQEAEEAVKFYVSIFKDGKTGDIARFSKDGLLPKGSILTMEFQLDGQNFLALNGGPYFTFTPAASFFVGCENVEEFDDLWERLNEKGKILMEAGSMPPFFEKFGWVQDKYGLSWQLGTCGIPQYIVPFLLFVGKQQGRAEEAINFYRSVFDSAEIESIIYYGKEGGETEGTVQHVSFTLNGQKFMASDGGLAHSFAFNEAVSFCVYCQTQAEIDRYWETLSEGGGKGQCGWLKDKFGISWQIIPASLPKMMTDENLERVERVSEVLLKMTKLDMEILQKAYES